MNALSATSLLPKYAVHAGKTTLPTVQEIVKSNIGKEGTRITAKPLVVMMRKILYLLILFPGSFQKTWCVVSV